MGDVRISDNDGDGLSAGNSDVEAVAVQDEPQSARAKLPGAGAERDDHDRRFLALETVNGADPGSLWKNLFQAADLHVVGRDEKDVVEAERA